VLPYELKELERVSLSLNSYAVVVDTTMVAFLRFCLLCSSLSTTVHSFQTIKSNNKSRFLLFSIRNDVEHAYQSSSTTEKAEAPFSVSRSAFLSHMIAATGAVVNLPSNKVWAIEGGETGVKLFGSSTPMQNSKGMISAEIQVNETPVKVSFQTPTSWPLLATTRNQGLQARDLENPDDFAFVQVISGISKLPSNGKEFRPILLQSVLSQQGHFGGYGAPMDVHVRATKGDPSVYSVQFISLAPPEKIETERQILVKAVPIRAANSLVLLVIGTTRVRYPQQKEALQRVVDSFEAVPAPATQKLIK
jgi:hypothetical protein